MKLSRFFVKVSRFYEIMFTLKCDVTLFFLLAVSISSHSHDLYVKQKPRSVASWLIATKLIFASGSRFGSPGIPSVAFNIPNIALHVRSDIAATYARTNCSFAPQ